MLLESVWECMLNLLGCPSVHHAYSMQVSYASPAISRHHRQPLSRPCRQLRALNLSYQLPTPVPSLFNGHPYVTLSTGAQASLFELIPGQYGKYPYCLYRSKGIAMRHFGNVHTGKVISNLESCCWFEFVDVLRTCNRTMHTILHKVAR